MYNQSEIVWYSPDKDMILVSTWSDGEVFINEHGPFKLAYNYNWKDRWVSEFYLIGYL